MPELTQAEFEVIAKFLHSEEPTKTAARLVLREGQSVKAAVKATGLLQPSVSRTIKRYRDAHEQILSGYDRRNSA